jgi:two-component system response regulator YesN
MTTMLLVSMARDVDPDHKPIQSALVQQAQAILINSSEEPKSVEEAARMLSVSTVWLTKKFIEEVGDSPANWARNWKINEARRLLTMDMAPIGEIAVRLGFASSQYFATVFRRETGMTPTEYRNITPEYLGH